MDYGMNLESFKTSDEEIYKVYVDGMSINTISLITSRSILVITEIIEQQKLLNSKSL